jgi:hypothetical protein
MTKQLRRVLTATAIAAAVALGGTTSASAGSLVPGCPGVQLSQPFLRFLDPASYALAPDGGFEANAAAWSLKDASVVPGNESYYLHGSSDSHSLRLPAGSSATSPASCVTMLSPTLRLVVRNTGSLLSTLKVEALYTDSVGLLRTTPVAVLTGTGSWQPTLPLPLLTNLTALPLLTDGAFRVAFRFTPLGNGGNWSIDDVYVDPYQGR